MKTLFCYFVVSLTMTIISSIVQIETLIIIRMICLTLNLVSLKVNYIVSFGIFLHKTVLLVQGVYLNQYEGAAQFIVDAYIMEKYFESQILVLIWRLFNAVGLTLIIYFQYNQQETIQLIINLLIPALYLGPAISSFIKKCSTNTLQNENTVQNSCQKLTTREYLRLKSRGEQELDFVQIDLEDNFSGDLKQLIKNISSNQDQSFVIKEINTYQEQVWKYRLNVIPIGICLIGKDFNPKFMNKTLVNILKKNLIESKNPLTKEINDVFINCLQFKSVDSTTIFEWPLSAQTKQEKKEQFQKISSLQYFDDDITQTCNLKQVLQNLKNGELNRFLKDQDQLLELVSTFQNLQNKQVCLDCRVLFDQHQNDDYMIIIQDFTKQNELSKLEEKNKFKNKVVQSFSHELRTPLNSASNFIQCALQDINVTLYQKQQYLKPCLQALQLQKHLINDIIDFSQINAKLLELKFTTFKLQQLIDDISEQFKFQFEFKCIGLAFEVLHPLSLSQSIKTDYQRLIQVLTNIIQNALKYSDKGYVLVKIFCTDPKEIEFSTQDEGIGLTKIQQTQISEIINQDQQQIKSQQEWHGFGLIVCQMLLRYLAPIHKNTIIIDSKGLDLGTKVSFTVSNHQTLQTQEQLLGSSSQRKEKISRQLSLPSLSAEQGLLISIKSKSPSRIILSKTTNFEDCDVSNYSIGLFDVSQNISQYKLNSNTLEALNYYKIEKEKQLLPTLLYSINETNTIIFNSCCKRILSVDDEVFNQKSLQLLLGQLGFEVDIVFNGRQAIEKILQLKKCNMQCQGYRLILMDCQMPIMDGWQATRRIKEIMKTNQQIPDIPIVGLTAFTSNEDIERCKQAGMVNVLNKPFDIQIFQSILKQLSNCSNK